MKIKATLGAAFVAASLCSMANTALAATIDINTCWTGSTTCDASKNTTVAKLELNQLADGVGFKLTNSANALDPIFGIDSNTLTPFLTKLWLSYDGPSATLSRTDTGGTSDVDATSSVYGNSTSAGLTFFINYGYPTASSPARFTDGEYDMFKITASGGYVVQVEDFLVPGYDVMVHVQGVGPEAANSYKYVGDGNLITLRRTDVPEPETVMLVGLGLLGMAFQRRRNI